MTQLKLNTTETSLVLVSNNNRIVRSYGPDLGEEAARDARILGLRLFRVVTTSQEVIP